jgi:hypothetical protein
MTEKTTTANTIEEAATITMTATPNVEEEEEKQTEVDSNAKIEPTSPIRFTRPSHLPMTPVLYRYCGHLAGVITQVRAGEIQLIIEHTSFEHQAAFPYPVLDAYDQPNLQGEQQARKEAEFVRWRLNVEHKLSYNDYTLQGNQVVLNLDAPHSVQPEAKLYCRWDQLHRVAKYPLGVSPCIYEPGTFLPTTPSYTYLHTLFYPDLKFVTLQNTTQLKQHIYDLGAVNNLKAGARLSTPYAKFTTKGTHVIRHTLTYKVIRNRPGKEIDIPCTSDNVKRQRFETSFFIVDEHGRRKRKVNTFSYANCDRQEVLQAVREHCRRYFDWNPYTFKPSYRVHPPQRCLSPFRNKQATVIVPMTPTPLAPPSPLPPPPLELETTWFRSLEQEMPRDVSLS